MVVVVFLALLILIRNRAENTVADLGALLPLGWAFAAGMVASVNPCGFFMLPAYLSYQLGVHSGPFAHSSPIRRGAHALGLGVVATSGFLLILAGVGVVVATGGQWLIRTFPYAGAAIGAALTLLGTLMLWSGRTIGLLAASRTHFAPQRSVRNVFLFGLAYAAGSLSCTLPVFLLVVGTSLASHGLLASFGQFISFGLGMGAFLITVTIGAALSGYSHAEGPHNRSSHSSDQRPLPHRRRSLPRVLLGAGVRPDPLEVDPLALMAASEQ